MLYGVLPMVYGVYPMSYSVLIRQYTHAHTLGYTHEYIWSTYSVCTHIYIQADHFYTRLYQPPFHGSHLHDKPSIPAIPEAVIHDDLTGSCKYSGELIQDNSGQCVL